MSKIVNYMASVFAFQLAVIPAAEAQRGGSPSGGSSAASAGARSATSASTAARASSNAAASAARANSAASANSAARAAAIGARNNSNAARSINRSMLNNGANGSPAASYQYYPHFFIDGDTPGSDKLAPSYELSARPSKELTCIRSKFDYEGWDTHILNGKDMSVQKIKSLTDSFAGTPENFKVTASLDERRLVAAALSCNLDPQ